MVQTESISQTLYFRCRPEHIYDALTNSKLISTYTQAPASGEAKEGSKFSWLGDSITGEYVKLEPGKLIQMKWRMKTWPENWYSDVTIKLSPVKSDVTKVELTHTNIPHDDAYGHHDQHLSVQHGWNQYFFERIYHVLGYAKVDPEEIDD